MDSVQQFFRFNTSNARLVDKEGDEEDGLGSYLPSYVMTCQKYRCAERMVLKRPKGKWSRFADLFQALTCTTLILVSTFRDY